MGKFALGVERFRVNTRAQATQFVKEVVGGIAAEVVATTPVKRGRARGNWTLGLGAPDRSVPYAPPPGLGDRGAGAGSLARIAEGLRGLKAGQDVYLSNGVGHILELEHGSSRQAPAGMATQAIRKRGGV